MSGGKQNPEKAAQMQQGIARGIGID